MRFFRRKRQDVLGITLANGEPQRLVHPFDKIAVYKGSIHLWASESGAVLMVPRDAGAFMSGTVMVPWDGDPPSHGRERSK